MFGKMYSLFINRRQRCLGLFVTTFLLLHFVRAQFDDDVDTVINLPKLGFIQGKVIETAWSKREVLQFVDVKYAESPTGKYRFKV